MEWFIDEIRELTAKEDDTDELWGWPLSVSEEDVRTDGEGSVCMRTVYQHSSQLQTIFAIPLLRQVGTSHEPVPEAVAAELSRVVRSFRVSAFSDAPLVPSGHP